MSAFAVELLAGIAFDNEALANALLAEKSAFACRA
jgi:hypothetical protein